MVCVNMGKTGRLDLRININSKNRLRAKAKYLNMSVTGFIEKIADNQIVFIDKKISNILKTYGYNLNTNVYIETDGESENSDSVSAKTKRYENKCESGGIGQ